MIKSIDITCVVPRITVESAKDGSRKLWQLVQDVQSEALVAEGFEISRIDRQLSPYIYTRFVLEDHNCQEIRVINVVADFKLVESYKIVVDDEQVENNDTSTVLSKIRDKLWPTAK